MTASEARRKETLCIDSAIFSKDVVLAASYALLDRAHFILSVGEDGRILVRVVPRRGQKLDGIVLDFNDQLVNYAVYYKKAADCAELKKLLLGTALYAIEEGK
jgi:hypothetical protein